MGQMTLPHPVNRREIRHNGDVHIRFHAVSTVFQLTPHLLPLPGVPVRDVGVFRLPFQRPHLAQHSQLPLFSAAVAGEYRPLALHFAFLAAVGALVEDAVQTVRPEGFADFQTLLLLPAEMVEGKSPVQPVGQLFHGFLADLLPGVEERRFRGHRDSFSDLQFII